MRWRLLARWITVGACLAGCAVISGIDDGRLTDGKPTDGGRTDGPGSMTPETGTDGNGGPCTMTTALADPGAVIHARNAESAPPVINDSSFDDWSCVDRVDMGQGAAEMSMPPGSKASFAFQWTQTDLYFYAHVVTALPATNNSGSKVFENDGIHLIIGRANPNADGSYRVPGDHQITIDHNGTVGDYVNGVFSTPVAEARVQVVAGSSPLDFEIEAKISAGALGVAGGNFSKNQALVFNVQLIDGSAPDQFGYRVWQLPKPEVCPCVKPGCCDRLGSANQNSPTCDMRCTETLLLDP